LAWQRHFFSPLTEWAAVIQARLQLMQGDLEAASRWVEGHGLTTADPEPLSYLHEVAYLTLGRILIALGKNQGGALRAKDEVALLHPLKAALHLLDRLLPVAEAHGRMGSVIEMLNLRALALQAQENLPEALAVLERALILAEPEGYVRIFLDEGEPMAELLGRLPAERGALQGQGLKEYVHKLLTAFDQDTTKRVGLKDKKNLQPLVEPLSERELEVLGLIAAGLTNQEIADDLVIALSTAKRHSINIYGKLGVSNRTQAVAKARQLNLL
jgi:LuxR family maltose regulon positive regulatory protein